MGGIDYIRNGLYAPHTLPIILSFSTLYIAPRYGITDPSLIMLYTTGVFAVISTFISVVSRPTVELKFKGFEDDPVILEKSSVAARADLKFTVNVKNRFKYVSKIFFIRSDDLDNIFLQLYWEPKELLQSEIIPGEEYYATLSFKNGYPSMSTFILPLNQRYEYSLKISCTPQCHEITKADIKVKLLSCNSNNLRLKLFLFCIKIKAESKSVRIKNE